MLSKIRENIEKQNLDAILINSTNEYLVEYNSLEENARYILTGFSGSTGDAIVTKNEVYLFVDGRYHIQADNEVDHNIVTVIKLQNGDTFIKKLLEVLPERSKLGLVDAKNSQSRYEIFQKYYDIKILDSDYIKTQEPKSSGKTEFVECGVTPDKKIEKLRSFISEEDAILVSNSEEVSYLFNLRDFSNNYASKITARAIITNEKAEIYYPEDFDKYNNTLKEINGFIYVDKNTVNIRDYLIIGNKAKTWDNNPIQKMKSIKTEEEIKSYKEAFKRTDMAVKAIREYIYNNDNISEYDVDKQLEYEFKKYGAKNLSFKSIIAKDKNSALAHYSKSSKDEIIQDGSLVLIDCGAYYEDGLATDITRVFVKGEPTELQKRVYTTVLKAFLNAYNTQITPDISGFDIDKRTRTLLDTNHIDGFVFNHGLGHGIGISVHEYPPNLSANELAKVKLEDNMCFTIEPGLYNKDYFGVRLENSCFLKNNKIHSFVKMNYEKKLIDYNILTGQEQEWLKEFEVL